MVAAPGGEKQQKTLTNLKVSYRFKEASPTNYNRKVRIWLPAKQMFLAPCYQSRFHPSSNRGSLLTVSSHTLVSLFIFFSASLSNHHSNNSKEKKKNGLQKQFSEVARKNRSHSILVQISLRNPNSY